MVKSISILILFLLFCIFKITSAMAITIVSCEGDAIETYHEDLRWKCKNCLEKKKFKSKFTVIFDNQHIEFISNTLPGRNIKLGTKRTIDGYESYEIGNDFVYYYYAYTYDKDNIMLGLAESSWVRRKDDEYASISEYAKNGKGYYHFDYKYDSNSNSNLDKFNGGYTQIDGELTYAYFITDSYPNFPRNLKGKVENVMS